VTYIDKTGKKQEKTFATEAEGKTLKEKLKSEGATNVKFDW
jgi:hypothetical protein